MDARKELILNTIIAEYIKAGQPVSSGMLVDKYGLDCSAATVRSEMADLEEEGFIFQPHTSSGRIPTEAAYRWYLEKMPESASEAIDVARLQEILADKNEQSLKQAAKELARCSGLAVFWAFHRNNLYYTGLSNLLSQPEFSRHGLIYDISAIIDKLDEIIDDMFDAIPEDPTLYLGSESPFGSFSTAVLCKYELDGHRGAIGILGPQRMDFARNLALMKEAKKILVK